MLIDPKMVYPEFEGPKKNIVRIRPSTEVIETYKGKIFQYWDKFFENLPKAKEFVENPSENLRGNTEPFSLRPIGQQLFCDFFLKLNKLNLLSEISMISKVPDDLTNEFWHYVLYNPARRVMLRNRSYARDYLFICWVGNSIKNLQNLKENFKNTCRMIMLNYLNLLIDSIF